MFSTKKFLQVLGSDFTPRMQYNGHLERQHTFCVVKGAPFLSLANALLCC
jgi:hypothetical protein